MIRRLAPLALLVLSLPLSLPIWAQRPDPAALIAAQRKAMEKLAFLDGVWRGPATTTLPTGEKHSVTQTERVGPFLDGSVKVIEGRAYNENGSVGFNAFAVISFNPATSAYSMRSYAQGNSGDFVVKATADGFSWDIPAGPMTIRYTATVKDGAWKEIGELIAPGKDPERIFEMNLKRVGDTNWPAAGAVNPK